MGDYSVKDGYESNPQRDFLDNVKASWMYQAATYRFARALVEERRSESVLDVGCGFGLKLAEFILSVCPDITGLDTEHAIDYCRSHHRFGTWVCANIEETTVDLGRQFDLIIAADIIEHLVDPDRLLALVARHAHAGTLLVLSTPERDLKRGTAVSHSHNPAHVREWNREELCRYLESRGWEILDHRLVEEARRRGLVARLRLALARLVRETKTTQLVLCRPRRVTSG